MIDLWDVYHHHQYWAHETKREDEEEEWGELPPELLESISKTLTIYGDYLRLRSQNPSPWLMLSRRVFFDLSDHAWEESNLVYRTVGFEVFKMNWGFLTCQRVETLGERLFFVGGNSSLSFCASEFDACSSDCIYFTDDYSESNEDDACGKHDLGVFSLRDKSIEPLPCFDHNSCSRLGWPLSIWVSPNPC
ncbi:putative F-box protein [Glycine soja]|nr:putative F-box protein [Glycine max]